MESVFIVCDKRREGELRGRVPPQLSVHRANREREVLVQETPPARCYLDRADDPLDVFDADELAGMRPTVTEPVVYSLSFSDIEFCKALLCAMVDDPDIVIDNDHHLRVPGAEFVRRIREQPEWDWRSDRTGKA